MLSVSVSSVILYPELYVVINLSLVDSDLTISLSLQWVIEPVPDPGPWPLYKIFLGPVNPDLQSGTQANENISQGLGLKPANEVKEALYIVNGIQPDYWYIFPLKPQEPNIYASVSWHVVTTKPNVLTRLSLTRIFRRPQLEAHYWLLPSPNHGTQVEIYHTVTSRTLHSRWL